MFTEAVREIVEEKIGRLSSVPDAFETQIERVQRASLRAVLDALDTLDTKDGLIVLSERNLLRVEQLTELIKEILTGPEYQSAVRSLMGEFDAQAALTFAYFDEVTDKLTVPRITQAILAERKKLTVATLLELSDQRISGPLREVISNAVIGGSKRADLLDAVRLLVVGDDKTDGRLLSASRQIVSDSFASADAAVTMEVTRQTGLEWFLYTGGLLDTTRPFCKARVNKFFHITEVQKWPQDDWAGKIPGTDAQNIFITRGGYNCQHALLPVSEFAVPTADRARIKN